MITVTCSRCGTTSPLYSNHLCIPRMYGKELAQPPLLDDQRSGGLPALLGALSPADRVLATCPHTCPCASDMECPHECTCQP